jgi:hypothetical protein
LLTGAGPLYFHTARVLTFPQLLAEVIAGFSVPEPVTPGKAGLRKTSRPVNKTLNKTWNITLEN